MQRESDGAAEVEQSQYDDSKVLRWIRECVFVPSSSSVVMRSVSFDAITVGPLYLAYSYLQFLADGTVPVLCYLGVGKSAECNMF